METSDSSSENLLRLSLVPTRSVVLFFVKSVASGRGRDSMFSIEGQGVWRWALMGREWGTDVWEVEYGALRRRRRRRRRKG